MALSGPTVAAICIAGVIATAATGGTRGGEAATCFGRAPTIVGTNAKTEFIAGTDGDDVILGRGGVDVILGGRGADRICGGPGNDWLTGSEGVDFLDGGTGRDILVALGAGRTDAGVMFGGPGADRCLGGTILRGCENTSQPATPATPPAPAPQPPASTPVDIPRFQLGAIECRDGGVLVVDTPRDARSARPTDWRNPEAVKWKPELQVQTSNGGWRDFNTGKPTYTAYVTSEGIFQTAYFGGWVDPSNQAAGWVTFDGLGPGTYRVRHWLHWQTLNRWYPVVNNALCTYR